jgi:hypothetical protein
MTIKVYSDRIEFGNYTLSLTPDGININGALTGEHIRNFSFLGEVSSYVSGGVAALPSTSFTDTIQKFDFAASVTSTDIGNLSSVRAEAAGSSSADKGFNYGGISAGTGLPALTMVESVDYFPFASSFFTSTSVGTIVGERAIGGHTSKEYGFVSGGLPKPTRLTTTNTLIRYPFANAVDAASVTSLSTTRGGHAAHSSSTHGYVAGGYSDPAPNPVGLTSIQKFSFVSPYPVTSVGDITQERSRRTTTEVGWNSFIAGFSSNTHGYSAGGQSSPAVPSNTYYRRVDKFPFSSDTNASIVGDLSAARGGAVGSSSNTSGYVSGGYGAQPSPPAADARTMIDYFPFATDNNATDVGDLVLRVTGASSQQF